MANRDVPNGFTFVKSLAGEAVIVTVPLADTQTIAKGDALIDSSGKAAIALSNSGALLGIAAEAAVSASGDTEIKMYPACPWYVFEGQCSGTFAVTSNFAECDITGATGVMEVNESASDEDVIQILQLAPNSELGANARVQFIIKRSSYIQLLDAR